MSKYSLKMCSNMSSINCFKVLKPYTKYPNPEKCYNQAYYKRIMIYDYNGIC